MYNFDLGTYAFTAKLAAFPTRILKEPAFAHRKSWLLLADKIPSEKADYFANGLSVVTALAK